MQLILLRHGPAGRPDPSRWPDDRARPLTPRGEEKTRAAARGLARTLAASGRIWSSPFARALRTAEILATTLDAAPPRPVAALAAGAPLRALLPQLVAAEAEEPGGTLVLVGHEPDLGLLAGMLMLESTGALPLKKAGAEIWAHREAQRYFSSGQADERLQQRRRDLFPWVDEKTRVVKPDLWIEGDTDFRLGGLTFRIVYTEGAHSPEDVMVHVVEERLLFAGDLLFAGRVPFVGNADSKGWLRAMDRMIALKPAVVVPGHGPASRDVERDLVMTRDYLLFLREEMGKAVADLEPFDAAYARVDWSRFEGLPAFDNANRINAYGTYLLMEKEAFAGGAR